MVTQIRSHETHKTEVLKAICTNGRTFNDIQKLTGLRKQELNNILSELATSNLVTIDGDSYKIDYGKQDSVIKRVIEWSKRKKLNYNVSSEHFFIEGDLLNRLCLEVFDFSKNEVIVVNPNVYPCSLSDKLKEKGDRTIKLITRSPFSEGKKNEHPHVKSTMEFS